MSFITTVPKPEEIDPTPIPEPPAAPVPSQEVWHVREYLTVHDAADSGSRIKAGIAKGVPFKIIGVVSGVGGEWAQLDTGGYVQKRYLSPVDPYAPKS